MTQTLTGKPIPPTDVDAFGSGHLLTTLSQMLLELGKRGGLKEQKIDETRETIIAQGPYLGVEDVSETRVKHAFDQLHRGLYKRLREASRSFADHGNIAVAREMAEKYIMSAAFSTYMHDTFGLPSVPEHVRLLIAETMPQRLAVMPGIRFNTPTDADVQRWVQAFVGGQAPAIRLAATTLGAWAASVQVDSSHPVWLDQEGQPIVGKSFFGRLVHNLTGNTRQERETLRQKLHTELRIEFGTKIADQARSVAGSGDDEITVGQIRDAHDRAQELFTKASGARYLPGGPLFAEILAEAESVGLSPEQEAYFTDIFKRHAACDPARYKQNQGEQRSLAIALVRSIEPLTAEDLAELRTVEVAAATFVESLADPGFKATDQLVQACDRLGAVYGRPGEVGLALRQVLDNPLLTLARQLPVETMSSRQARQLFARITSEDGVRRLTQRRTPRDHIDHVAAHNSEQLEAQSIERALIDNVEPLLTVLGQRGGLSRDLIASGLHNSLPAGNDLVRSLEANFWSNVVLE